MSTKRTSIGTGDNELRVRHQQQHAAGPKAVAVSLSLAVRQMGVRRTVRTLRQMNQTDGFDCMSCAWPDPAPGERHTAEFCENGAKAVAEEATTARVTRDFFAEHSIESLAGRDEFWLGKRGRLTEPMVRRRDATHYEPISWDDAFALIGRHLRSLP